MSELESLKQQILDLKTENALWRGRANEVADTATNLRFQIVQAKDAFAKIRQMGYVGDPHVDLAHEMFNKLNPHP